MMIELKALNFHWLENIGSEKDLCAHGAVFLKLGDKIISEKEPDDLSVSASAWELLKTLKANHSENSELQLIPHCGTLWEIDDKNELVVLGCDFGINWKITHANNQVIHQFKDGEIVETNFDEWRDAVCNFSDEVMNFYKISSPKIFEDEEEEKVFELFMREWKRLRIEAFN